MEGNNHLLESMLPLAVSMRIHELRSMPRERRSAFDDPIVCLECKGRRDDCATCEGKGMLPRNEAYAFYIGAHGDDILFKSKRKGDTARAFNILVDAVALMSFFPGGVEVLGSKFEIKEFIRRLRKVKRYIRRVRKVEEK